MLQNSNKRYPSLDQVNANGILKVEVVNQPSPIDYTALLTSIDTKLDDLALIQSELVSANTTLTSINGDTTAIKGDTSNILTQVTTTNTKLEDVKTKLDSQITLLGDLKTELQSANTSLDNIETDTAAIKASLVNVEADVALIKADIATIKTDVAAIKTSVAAIALDTTAIKNSVASIDTKLDTVNSNLDSIETKLDTIHSDLVTINGTLQAEFDETQVKLDTINSTLESSLTTFQVEDCGGQPIGTPEVAQKGIILNKVVTSICNVQELADAINDGQPIATGKAHDVNSYVLTVGQTVTIPANHFTTIALFAAKGEFKIENTSNDHSTIVTTTGTVSTFLEISEDGVGTATGATSIPQGLDTRANANDLAITNAYTITAVRNGVLQLETYK